MKDKLYTKFSRNWGPGGLMPCGHQKTAPKDGVNEDYAVEMEALELLQPGFDIAVNNTVRKCLIRTAVQNAPHCNAAILALCIGAELFILKHVILARNRLATVLDLIGFGSVVCRMVDEHVELAATENQLESSVAARST